MNIIFSGQTPLCLAVEQEDLEMVTLLLDAGCSINQFTQTNPLTLALRRNNKDIINKLLLKKGHDWKKVDNEGLTILHQSIGRY